jgi:hypothetical protein
MMTENLFRNEGDGKKFFHPHFALNRNGNL